MDIAKLDFKPHEFKLPSPYGNLVAWQFVSSDKKKPKAVVVMAHGNAQNISSHFYSMYWVLKNEVDYVVFDYPGYGGSEGEPSPKSTVDSAKMFLKWTRENYPNTPIVAMGQSLGGAVMMKAILDIKSEIHPCMVVMDSTFSSYKSVARSVLAQNVWTWLFQPLAYLVLSDEYAPKGGIQHLSPIPLLVFHGQEDSVVDLKEGERVFAEANDPKTWISVPHGKHIETFTKAPMAAQNQKIFLEAMQAYCK